MTTRYLIGASTVLALLFLGCDGGLDPALALHERHALVKVTPVPKFLVPEGHAGEVTWPEEFGLSLSERVTYEWTLRDETGRVIASDEEEVAMNELTNPTTGVYLREETAALIKADQDVTFAFTVSAREGGQVYRAEVSLRAQAGEIAHLRAAVLSPLLDLDNSAATPGERAKCITDEDCGTPIIVSEITDPTTIGALEDHPCLKRGWISFRCEEGYRVGDYREILRDFVDEGKVSFFSSPQRSGRPLSADTRCGVRREPAPASESPEGPESAAFFVWVKLADPNQTIGVMYRLAHPRDEGLPRTLGAQIGEALCSH